MQLIKSEKFLGNNKILIGDLSSDMVLQTLGKIYIRSGNNLKLLTDITETIAQADPSNVIIVNSSQELDSLEYPGDGKFIYNSGNSVLYLTYKDRYIAIIEVLNKQGNYVKKEGDTMSGTLEVATTKVPFIVHSSKLVKNLNAEYLNGEPAEVFTQKSKDEGITGSWRFLSDCIAEAKWQFLNNVSIKADVISSGSLQSPIFANGFTGTGWRLDGSTNTLTIDNLVVRKVMQVYELVINKISATNGSLWVSNSSKIDSVYTTDGSDRYYISGGYLIYITNTELFNQLLNDHTADELAQDVITNGENSEYYTLLYTYNIESEINKNIKQVIVQNNQITTEGLYSTYFEGGKLYVISTDKDEYSTLKTGDIVRCQKFQDNTIKYYDALVYNQIDVNKYVIQISKNVWDKYSKIEYATNGDLVKVTTKENDNLYKKTRFDYQLDSSDTDYFVSKLAQPAQGDDLVQIGNIQDPTRQGAIYLTATDDQGPYIEVLDGINRPDYSTLKEVPVFITYLYKNIQYYVSTEENIKDEQKNIIVKGVSLGKFTISADNTITKSDPETNSGTSLYGYKYPYDASFLIKKEVSETGSKYLSKYSNPVKVRLGNLEGIYNYLLGNKQPHGYGLYGENVYLTGEFYLNNGKSVVDFGEEQIMLKYKEAGMWIGEDENGNPKIQFAANIIDLDFSMDSEGPTSKVLFEDGTMKFYHKATAEDLAKIDTSVGDIKQEGGTVWVKSIYLGYGVPNVDADEPLSPEPLLIFCDYNGRDLYNLGPSGMFKTQIQSPTVYKKSIEGIRLTGDYTVNGDSIVINGVFDTINYFYITEGNNDIQKRCGIAITYQDGTIKVKTIKMIASSMCFSSVSGESANGNPPQLVFDSNLSAETLPQFVRYFKDTIEAPEILLSPSLPDEWWVDGNRIFEYNLFNIRVEDKGNQYIGTYERNTTQYQIFWDFINNYNDSTGTIVDDAVGLLKELFKNTHGQIAYEVNIKSNTGNVIDGSLYSPIYYSYKVKDVTDVVWELAYNIFKQLVTATGNKTYIIGSISSHLLIEESSRMYSDTNIPSSALQEVQTTERSIVIYNKKHAITLSKYFIDNNTTAEGTTTTQAKLGTNISDISLAIEDTGFTFQIDNSIQNKYLFYK